MDLDDIPIGRVLTRREAIAFLGATGALLFLGCSDGTASTDPGGTSSSCIVRPELTEGPYYVDEELNRSDIRPDPSDGSVKAGALLALTFNVSRAASNACTPLSGAIVDVWHCDALGVYSDVADPGFNTVGKKFLRGYQVTASAGSAYEFTSQLFFDDSLTDQVHAQAPYSATGQRTLRNSGDGIYNGGGAQLVLDVTQAADGYAATFDIALENA